jgi:multiple sugar transport system ATP-binding protein
VILGIRPSDFEDAQLADSSWARMSAKADVTEELGSEIHVIFSLEAAPVKHDTISDISDGDDEDAAVVIAEGRSLWTARVAARSHVRSGQPVELAVDTSNLQFFDPVSALSIGHPAASEVVAAGEAANA